MNENEQREQALTLTQQAKTFVVSNQQDYDNAGEVCKDIKIKIKTIEDYWKDLKDKAYKSWKDICAKEKELLAPYTAAETEIKGKMTAWYKQKLEEERLLREEQERYRKEEEARLLALAIEAEKEGKEEHSEFLVEQAEAIHVAKFEQPKQVKTAGIAAKTVWRARIINASLVPIEINGILLRPINETAINKMAAMVKGKSNIPGVEFYEDVSIAASRG